MKIILVPEGIRKGRITCLQRRALLGVLTGLALAPLLVGVLAYHAYAALGGGIHPNMDLLRLEQRELVAQRVAVHRAQIQDQAHMNALAQSFGQLQAQMMRVIALGNRLSRSAGLDGREFKFSAPNEFADAPRPPGQPSLAETLAEFSADLDQQSARLQALAARLQGRETAQVPTTTGVLADARAAPMAATPGAAPPAAHKASDTAGIPTAASPPRAPTAPAPTLAIKTESRGSGPRPVTP